MKPDELLRKIEGQLADAPNDYEALHSALGELKKLYEKQSRRLNSLTKLSDSTEAKLTETNSTLTKLLRNLKRFVPIAVVDVLMRDGAEQLPANSREKITVFFSDIVGFTTITERLDPERLAPLMTQYFTEMSEICTKWGGTLDQFIGDAIVIFFGAPQSQGYEEDAKRALGMALDMQDRLRHLRLKWAHEGLTTPFEVRMGLSTGYCNVGNFGSHDRLHYTAIGTAVNSASRIQSLSEPSQILLAEATYMLVRDHFHCTEKQTATLHGQNYPTILYQPNKDQEASRASTITADEQGYRFYFDPSEIADKSKAKTMLRTALSALDDTPTQKS